MATVFDRIDEKQRECEYADQLGPIENLWIVEHVMRFPRTACRLLANLQGKQPLRSQHQDSDDAALELARALGRDLHQRLEDLRAGLRVRHAPGAARRLLEGDVARVDGQLLELLI